MADRRVAAVFAALALLGATGCARAAGGGAAEALFASGNKAYEEGHYDKAVDDYRQVLDSGASTAAVHYNLGNAYFKLRKLGPALLEYERAARLAPRDADIRNNLEYARGLAVDRITPASSPLTSLGITYLLDLTSPAQDAAVFVLAWLVCGFALTPVIVSRKDTVRRAALYVAAVAALPALAAGSSLGIKTYLASSETSGIVMQPQVDVLSGAGEGNPTLFTVHEGLKVRIRGRDGEWVQVSLPDGLTGWLKAGAIEEI